MNEPQNDNEWEELLTAYLDGELEAGERRAVEGWLAQHPERAAQLEALRRLGGLLQAWTVQAPEPDPAFVRRLMETDEKTTRAGGWFESLRRAFQPAWAAAAALFMAGMLTGAGGYKMLQDRLAAPKPATMAAVVTTASAAPAPVISPGQAATLSRELQAAELRDRLMRDLQRRDYDSAVRRYQDLRENYRDSEAVRQLRQNPALRAAAEQLEASGRI